ncbi:MAG TPA: hypothetical protein VHX42_01665, partial [Candidatus Babeliales bacterium]|nr:hypothetical protein [Candidatus Babeliales bacterium]
MKKQIISLLCIFNALNGMELQPLLERTSEYKKHEWDAKAYDNSNRIETEAFISLLLKYKIITKDRTILDVGCGTGTIA